MAKVNRTVARHATRGHVLAGFNVKKVQSLLKSKTADGLALALSLLDLLGVTKADRETVFTDRVISSIVRDPKISAETVLRWEQLLASIRGSPRLVACFSKHATKAVNQQRMLNLNSLITLSHEAVKPLAQYKGALPLNGLAALSEEQAKALSQHNSWLYLEGLNTISDEAAKSLARHKGEKLYLTGLTALSDNAAEALAQHEGSLFLKGLTTLADKAGKALAQHNGSLHLDGLSVLSDRAAKALGANPDNQMHSSFRR